MDFKNVFLKPLNNKVYKSSLGLNGEVINIYKKNNRVYYKVIWDGMIKYIPIKDVEKGLYIIVSSEK